MKNKSKFLKIFLVLFSTIIFISVVKAYLSNIQIVRNEFKVANIDVRIEENFNNTTWPELTTKEVNIVNYSDSKAVIRILYTEMWKYENRIISNTFNGENVVIKNFTDEFLNDFVYYDGWYYYKKVLNGKESVRVLNSIKLREELGSATDQYLEGNYELTFHYEALQPTTKAIKEVWGLDATIEEGNINWGI